MIIRSETLTKYRRQFGRAMHNFEILNFFAKEAKDTHETVDCIQSQDQAEKNNRKHFARISTFYYPEIRKSYLRFTRARKPRVTDTKQESILPGHSRSHKEAKSSNFHVKRQEQLLRICLPAIHDEDRKNPQTSHCVPPELFFLLCECTASASAEG